MTLVAAWVRKTKSNEELIVASDSRVSGGLVINCAPKLFRLERNDAVLAYCGPTMVAYPLILQIKAGLDAHDETKERVIDVVDLKAHIEKTIERLRLQLHDLPSKDDSHRSFKFLLAGYSWKYSRFRAWVFRYDISTGEFNAHSMPNTKHQFIFMSDVGRNEINAKDQLLEKLYRTADGPKSRLDWEPLQILISTIENEKIGDIGGPPQLMKVYKHANTLPINVLWPEEKMHHGHLIKRYEITHLGRPLLGYERTRLLTLDPLMWDFIEPWNIRKRATYYNDCEERKLRWKLLSTLGAQLAWRNRSLALQDRLSSMVEAKCTNAELLAVMQEAGITC